MTATQSSAGLRASANPTTSGLAVAGGALIAVQARVNGELGDRLRDGIGAAALSFLGGLLVLTVLVVLSPGIRRGLRQLTAAVRGGQLPRWYLVAGAFGASLALAQSTTALVIGIAVFTVAAIAGQTLSGLLVDGVGFAGGIRQRPDRQRSVGAALVLVAAVIAAAPEFDGTASPARAVLPALAPLAAGFLLGFQLAMNGAMRKAAGSPLAVTWLSFLVGAAFLSLIWAATSLSVGTDTAALPSNWWLYLGGPCGVVFVALSAVLVQRIGLLLLAMGTIGGQLIGSIALDVAAPTGADGLSPWTVLGAAMTLAAVVIATRRASPRTAASPCSPESPPSGPKSAPSSSRP